MLQNSLFKNLPKLDEDIKAKNKAAVSKAKGAGKSSPGSASVRSSNKIGQALELIRQKAGERLKAEEGKYDLIRDEATLVKYVDQLIKDGIAGIDTETTGLDPIQDKLVGTCLYSPSQKGAYIPHTHITPNGTPIENQISFELMARETQRMVDAKVKFIYHNAKFDIRFIWNNLKVLVVPYWCTLLASNFLNENEPHGLKVLHNKYVLKNVKESDELNTFSNLFEGIPFDMVPIEIGYLYAAKDPVITYELFKFQEPYLTPEHPLCKGQLLTDTASLYRDIELPLIEHLAMMEEEGVYINKDKAAKLSKDYTEKMKVATLKAVEWLKSVDFMKLAPDKRSKLSGPMEVGGERIESPVNIGSPTQLAILLYDLFGAKSPVREKPRGTGEDILEAIKTKSDNEGLVEFLSLVLEYRGYKKLLSTYIDKMPAIVKPKTGKLHGQYNQYGAKTGRFSSSDPNLQNIPSGVKEIRQMFEPGEGYVFVGSDFSQQEPRVLAHLAYILFGDNRMMDSYKAGRDLYSWIASEVYKQPYEQCMEKHPVTGALQSEGKKMRNSVKAVVLGLMYGRGVNSIAEQLGWTKDEAQRIIDMFFDTFPAIEQVVDYYKQMAVDKGYVQTVFGRKRRLPEINLPEFGLTYEETGAEVEADVAEYYVRQLKNAYGKRKIEIKNELKGQGIKVADNGGKIADAERQCLNSVIQGSGADITKKAMLLLGRSQELRALGYRMVLTVHDEIIGRCPRENALKVSALVTKIMISSCEVEVLVPMKCDAEIVECWYGKDVTEELEAA